MNQFVKNKYRNEGENMEANVLTGLAGLILTIGLVSVLVQGWGLHKKPKEMDEELKQTYVPELLRKKKDSGDAS